MFNQHFRRLYLLAALGAHKPARNAGVKAGVVLVKGDGRHEAGRAVDALGRLVIGQRLLMV